MKPYYQDGSELQKDADLQRKTSFAKVPYTEIRGSMTDQVRRQERHYKLLQEDLRIATDRLDDLETAAREAIVALDAAAAMAVAEYRGDPWEPWKTFETARDQLREALGCNPQS